MANFFPVCAPAELDTRFSLPVSSLIAGDTSGLLVPLYSARECPEASRIAVSTYLAGYDGFVIPVYSSLQAMMTNGRAVSSITAVRT